MNVKNTLFVICLLILGTHAFCQEIITTTCGSASNSSGSLDWSIGEPIIETVSSTNNYLTQGFLQPSYIIVTAIDDYSNTKGITSFPNPCSAVLNISHADFKVVDIEMLDASGQVLLKKTLTGSQNELDLNAFAAGFYFLRVYGADNNLIKVLKIDKVK